MPPPSALDVEAATDTQAATFIDRLSLNGVPARRSKSPAVSTGLATYASSDMFSEYLFGAALPRSRPNFEGIPGKLAVRELD